MHTWPLLLLRPFQRCPRRRRVRAKRGSERAPSFSMPLGSIVRCTGGIHSLQGRVDGPAVIQEYASTTVLFPQDHAEVTASGELLIRVGQARGPA